jgi:lysophospholipase L1-like esterase
MQPDNKIKEPSVIVSITLGVLLILSFIKFEYLLENVNFTVRNIDLLYDIKTEPAEEQPVNEIKGNFPEQKMNLASFGFMEIPSGILNFLQPKESSLEYSLPYQGAKTPIIGNTKQLSYFFDALKNVKSKTVRIAHYGDSMIEGDLISSDIREALQNKFGGNGVGWLGIVSQDITFRLTTKHSYSTGNWETASVYTSNPKSLPIGISGEASVPKGNAWVKYETTTVKRYLKDFSVAKLYYSNAKASQIKYSFDGGAAQTAQLVPGSGLQELIMKPSGKAKSIKIDFPTADQAVFFGVSLENNPGLYVDNLPLRGNSGVDLQQIKPDMMKDFAKYMDYKLIILEFGLNVLGARMDYNWYEREMLKVIQNIKTAFPKTSILMISVHDKAAKKGSSFATDPAILKLLETQKGIANKAGVALWSMFDAMGGENSMPGWVNSNPPLAFKDYIHFNDQGAKKIAQLFSDALMDEFNKQK